MDIHAAQFGAIYPIMGKNRIRMPAYVNVRFEVFVDFVFREDSCRLVVHADATPAQ